MEVTRAQRAALPAQERAGEGETLSCHQPLIFAHRPCSWGVWRASLTTFWTKLARGSAGLALPSKSQRGSLGVNGSMFKEVTRMPEESFGLGPIFHKSTWWPVERTASEKVHMEMRDALSSVFAMVDDEAEALAAVFDAEFVGNLACG